MNSTLTAGTPVHEPCLDVAVSVSWELMAEAQLGLKQRQSSMTRRCLSVQTGAPIGQALPWTISKGFTNHMGVLFIVPRFILSPQSQSLIIFLLHSSAQLLFTPMHTVNWNN